MTSDREEFFDYTESSPASNHMIQTADGTKYCVRGTGTWKAMVRNEEGETVEMTIKDVLHVPELDERLLSRSTVREMGNTIVLAPDEGYILTPDGDKIPVENEWRTS
jgi:hypothetical protein